METEPLFDEEIVAEFVAVERAVKQYRRKEITRAEMVEKVRAIVDGYDALSRTTMLEEIEETLGEKVPELWAPLTATGGHTRGRGARRRAGRG
jgi:hypothetical protein